MDQNIPESICHGFATTRMIDLKVVYHVAFVGKVVFKLPSFFMKKRSKLLFFYNKVWFF